jgi:hypothetical protein
MRESEIQNAILHAFAGDVRVRLWRNNSGVASTRDGSRFVRFGVPGQADLSGILKGGRRVELEVKTAAGRVSPQQQAFGEMVSRYGGLYAVVRCVEDAVAAVDGAFNDAR